MHELTLTVSRVTLRGSPFVGWRAEQDATLRASECENVKTPENGAILGNLGRAVGLTGLRIRRIFARFPTRRPGRQVGERESEGRSPSDQSSVL